MRQALSKYLEIGFTIKPRQSRRVKTVRVSGTDFADDQALTTDTVAEAEKLTQEIERTAATVGLQMNEGKTKLMTQNIEILES